MDDRLGIAAVFAVVAGLIAAAVPAAGVQQVGTTLTLSASATARATATGCSNSPGPTVTLTGELSLGGLGAVLIFRNNVKGTHEHTETTTVSVELIPEGETISIPKQPVQGGTGGNPFIWVQFTDGDGNPLSGEISLGRCVQGLRTDVSASFTIPADATLEVSGDNCEHNPGPYITLSGELSLGGVNARIIFRNNDNPVGGPHQATVQTTADIVIIPEGETIQFPKQPVLGGVGGNPYVWVQFVDEDGMALSDEIFLGRCVQDL